MLIAGTEEIPTRNNFALGKIDFNMNSNHTLSGTYNYDKGRRSPYGVLGDFSSYGSESLKHVVSTKLTSVLSGSSVNELNVGYSDSRPSGDIPLSDVDAGALGLSPFVPDRRVGQLVVSGVSDVGYRVDASFYRQRSYTLKNAYSQSRGNHSLRAGGEWTYYNYDVVSCSRGCNGVWDFRSIPNLLAGERATVRRAARGGLRQPARPAPAHAGRLLPGQLARAAEPHAESRPALRVRIGARRGERQDLATS